MSVRTLKIIEVSQFHLKAKLEKLARDEGFKDPADYLASDRCFTTGICLNVSCDHTTDCESGTENDWCDSCETNTIVSGIGLNTHASD